MTSVRVTNFAVSLDGYGAGPDQRPEHPLGIGGEELHDWFVATRTFRALFGQSGGTEGLDDEWAARGTVGFGATIMGRNMFGPVRGPWGEENWTGWWGDNPPYHHQVFVLTHQPRESVPMAGGTVFHFVTDGIHAALDRAREAAGGQDVKIAGGVATIRQYLHAGLIDEMHLAFAPILLGAGERLFDQLGVEGAGLKCVELVSSGAAAHARFTRA
ncbi:MAG TPA: dihydrofolate reductase family protein [Pseudonocardia sp.]|jgi:dihydrofolate reductase|nr:dihydrofolate reductase family protein [Pseudonocardia sp.]